MHRESAFQVAPLVLPAALSELLREWAQAALPEEACGLLVGEIAPIPRTGVGPGTLVHGVLRLHNAAARRREDLFALDPEEHLRAECLAQAAGLEVVGVWHSHPDSGAVPSARDTEGALEGWSYPIVGWVRAGRLELRSWRLQDGRFVEEPIQGPPGPSARFPSADWTAPALLSASR